VLVEKPNFPSQSLLRKWLSRLSNQSTLLVITAAMMGASFSLINVLARIKSSAAGSAKIKANLLKIGVRSKVAAEIWGTHCRPFPDDQHHRSGTRSPPPVWSAGGLVMVYCPHTTAGITVKEILVPWCVHPFFNSQDLCR